MKITIAILALSLILKSVLAGYSTGVRKPADQKGPAVEHRPVIYPTDPRHKYPHFAFKPEIDAVGEKDFTIGIGQLSDHSSDVTDDVAVEWKAGPVPGYPASGFGGLSDGSTGGKPNSSPGHIQVGGISDHGVADKYGSFSDSSADVVSDIAVKEKHGPVLGKPSGWIDDAGIESGIKTDLVQEPIPAGGIGDGVIADKSDKFPEHPTGVVNDAGIIGKPGVPGYPPIRVIQNPDADKPKVHSKTPATVVVNIEIYPESGVGNPTGVIQEKDFAIENKDHVKINSGPLPSNPSEKEIGVVSDIDITPIEDKFQPKDYDFESKETGGIIEAGLIPSTLPKDVDDTAVIDPIEDKYDSKDYGIENKEPDDVIIDGIKPGSFPVNVPREEIDGTYIVPDAKIPEINIPIIDEEPKLNLFDMSNSLQLTRFLHLIDEAGLQDMLNDKEPMTIFAPSDYALSKLHATDIRKLATDKDFLREYVLSYCVDGSIYGPSMVNNLALKTRADKMIYANKYGETWYINGMPITIKDQRCSNGVIHVLDEPLPPVSNGDILQTLETLGNFNIFSELIKNAKLDEEILKDEGPFTIFAPVDSAFSKLPASNLEWLKWDIPAIKKLFGQLTVKGTYYTSWIPTVPNSELEPLEKEATLVLSGYPDAITVNDVRLLERDITADNGCIHVIDDIWFLSELGSVPPSAGKV